MKRIYFLLPSVESARNIVGALVDQGYAEKHIHLIANEQTPLEELPEAGLLQKSDFIPAIERGIPIGGTAGLLAGLAAMTIPGVGALGGGVLIASMLAGAGVGTLLSSIVATDLPSSRHKRFLKAIEQGKLLMLVDVPKGKIEEVTELVLRHYPEAELEDIEPKTRLLPPGY